MLSLLIAVLLISKPTASAQILTDPAKKLEQQFKGATVRVRDLLSDSKIRYDAAGNLVGSRWHSGRWTWHSTVEVTAIEAKGAFLRIKGNRLLLNYNRGI